MTVTHGRSFFFILSYFFYKGYGYGYNKTKKIWYLKKCALESAWSPGEQYKPDSSGAWETSEKPGKQQLIKAYR